MKYYKGAEDQPIVQQVGAINDKPTKPLRSPDPNMLNSSPYNLTPDVYGPMGKRKL